MAGFRLCRKSREVIRVGLVRGVSFREIARELGCAVTTVSREVCGAGGRSEYRAHAANRLAKERRRRPKIRKLSENHVLAQAVENMLELRWSPQQISRVLRKEHPNDANWHVSHETIYQSLYVQGRGGLRKELHAALRTGRARRRKQGTRNSAASGRISHMVNISERPPEVEDRAVPGHWEGDLIIGKGNHSQIGTLVERQTRFVMLIHLPNDRCAETVQAAIANKIRCLPKQLKLSLTWDQGKEMAAHQLLHLATGLDIYFCDPHSPWQRGTNENTNGLLRQYLPKGTDLSIHSPRTLNKIARELNQRPRMTLDWMTPAEKFAQLVATIH